MNVGRNLTFTDIEVDAGPIADLFHYIKECDHFFNGTGDKRVIVRILFASQSEAARSHVVSFV